MIQQRAYLVFGPESSGTRLMTRLLIEGGCLGNDSHEQAFDAHLPQSNDVPIVWRRSFPHAAKWTNIALMLYRVEQKGYLPHVIIMVRDMYSVIQSQLAVGHVKDVRQSIDNIKRAYNLIWSIDYNLYNVVTYENVIRQPAEVVSLLTDKPKLEMNYRTFNANDKWYDDGRFNSRST